MVPVALTLGTMLTVAHRDSAGACSIFRRPAGGGPEETLATETDSAGNPITPVAPWKNSVRGVSSTPCPWIKSWGTFTGACNCTVHEVPAPSHTPHSSTIPLIQHTPLASATVQQEPCMSTNTPVPPQTPQTSKALVQHSPSASNLAPPGQHSPRTLVKPESQQERLKSTTPLEQVLGISQYAPQ